ncbi:MAG TPA: hypothetical protein VGN63_00350 [Flavisolibacter sp.]|jgi:hypothetical protein|nr:hypothetical protein [Flavisolibacter sp.]
MKIAESFWYPEQQLIITRLSGNLDMADVEKWETSLLQALSQVPDNGLFKIMVDLHGFKAVNFEVHKKFRVIIPQTLAHYGWRVGYLDMFPEANVNITTTRGVQCFAAVHVHQDESKIKNYDANYSRPNERFFTDPLTAREWIHQLQPQTTHYEK